MSQRAHLFTSCMFWLTVTASVVGAACSGPAAGTPDGGTAAPDQSGSNADLAEPPLPPHTRLIHLISSDYNIPPGSERYQCQRITADRDLYILKITPVSPSGVHHEVLAIDPSNGPDGVSRCGPLETNWRPLFASGVGSPSLVMPEGVALKVPAGSKLVLDLHLFNARPTGDINGTAAVDVIAAETDEGYQLATVPFIGPVNFTIKAPGTVSGSCTLSNDTSFFAVFPHMHTTGKHIKISAGRTGSETVVWDDDYNFEEQRFGAFPDWKGPKAVALKKGERISVTCTYDQAGFGKKFGDSTTDEMCFAISYVTPAINTLGGSAFCPF